MCVCVCVCVMSSKCQSGDHMVAEVRDSLCFAWSQHISTPAGRCSQRLMEWKCVCRGFPRQQKVPLLALQIEIDCCSSSELWSLAVFNHLPPHPLGLVRLRNRQPSTVINSQAPNSPPVQGKSGMRLATSPMKEWL